MRRLYYTLCVLLCCALALVAVRWFSDRPAPPKVQDASGVRWHLVDPAGVLKPLLPLPPAANAVLRSLHIAGTAGGVTIIEAQTRLPGWMLRLLPVAGFTHRRSSWDLCLVREGISQPLSLVPDPNRRTTDIVSAWLTGTPQIQADLKGSNPFQFTSFCPGETVEAALPGPSEGATLFLSAARSPHLSRFLPGLTPERVEAGPDWANVAIRVKGRLREASWGAPSGPPGPPLPLSLRLRYHSDAGGVPGLLRQILPDGAIPTLIRDIEAECRSTEGGERCDGRLTLTY